MDKTPLVSVVVPVYNMESTLPETLEFYTGVRLSEL